MEGGTDAVVTGRASPIGLQITWLLLRSRVREIQLFSIESIYPTYDMRILTHVRKWDQKPVTRHLKNWSR